MTDYPAPGTWTALAAGLDHYHAINLLEALKIIPDTGDWHGSLRIACQMVLHERHPTLGEWDWQPNQTAEQMLEQINAR